TLLGVPVAAQLVAVTVAIWNPFVAERLLQGHWSLLTGYAALPWTALAAHRLRQRGGGHSETRSSRYRDWAALAGCFAAAGLTPTGALLAGVVGLIVAGRRNFPGALALLIAASAPWLIATAASGAGTETSDPAGIAAFAARAEPALGTLGSLAGLGGIWNADAVPWSRTTPLALIGTAILLVLVALGARTVAGWPLRPRSTTDKAPAADSARTGRRLLGLAVTAVLLPALGATSRGLAGLRPLRRCGMYSPRRTFRPSNHHDPAAGFQRRRYRGERHRQAGQRRRRRRARHRSPARPGYAGSIRGTPGGAPPPIEPSARS